MGPLIKHPSTADFVEVVEVGQLAIGAAAPTVPAINICQVPQVERANVVLGIPV